MLTAGCNSATWPSNVCNKFPLKYAGPVNHRCRRSHTQAPKACDLNPPTDPRPDGIFHHFN